MADPFIEEDGSEPCTVERANIFNLLELIAVDSRGVDSEVLRRAYPMIFHEVSKQLMWNLHLIFAGRVEVYGGEPGTEESHDMYLPYRLTDEERARSVKAFRILWNIIESKKLESTPISSAKGDEHFQQFLRAASTTGARRRSKAKRLSRKDFKE